MKITDIPIPGEGWDDDARVLVNSDFAYLNSPVKSQSTHRIVACSMPIGEKRMVLYTTFDGPVWRIELPKGDVQQLLGSWITVERELVADAFKGVHCFLCYADGGRLSLTIFAG